MADESKLKTVTLLSDVKLKSPTEEDEQGLIGHRGEVHKLKVGEANLLISSNQALEGEHKAVKPFPNAKADAAEKARAEAKTAK